MRGRYQQEQEDFREAFSFLKDKKIALYGIGRRTATLLPALKDYHVVCLLDRNPENIGRDIDGIFIRPLADADREADAIIICADPGNWQIIYRRIAAQVTIPVYFMNGQRAALENHSYHENPYWNFGRRDLETAIAEHDVISFDFFDTLVTRKVLTPSDVFRLVELRLRTEHGISIHLAEARQHVAAQCSSEATLHEIYQKLVQECGFPNTQAEIFEQLEMNLERELCVPRKAMIDLLLGARSDGKQIYILSDTYLDHKEFRSLMQLAGLDDVTDEQVFLSSELKKSKADGALFRELKGRHPKARILHIGDNQKSDIEQARKNGIDAFHIMRPAEMLEASSIGDLVAEAQTLDDQVILGLLAARLFSDPFSLHATKGKVLFHRAEDFGYAVFGGALTRYAEWLYAMAEAHHLDRLLFFARDGYFLQKDFIKLCQRRRLPKTIEASYVPISRQLIFIATMHTEEDLLRVATFPYLGKFRDYLFQRFNIQIDADDPHKEEILNAACEQDRLKTWIAPYRVRIWAEQKRQEENYRNYLEQHVLSGWSGASATVDFSFYGTTQFYFQKLLGRRFPGFYMIANLEPTNLYSKACEMYSCFQTAEDLDAHESPICKKENFMESFLCAPYGMIRYIGDDGNLVSEEDRANQRHFDVKEKVNDGAMEFMEEYARLLPMDGRNGADSIEAKSFYMFLNDGCQLSPDILQGFYYDNDIIGNAEAPLEI